MNQFPECLSEYFYTLIRPIVTVVVAAFIKLMRDFHYRNALAKEIRDRFLNRFQDENFGAS
jgi:hypothetical protein